MARAAYGLTPKILPETTNRKQIYYIINQIVTTIKNFYEMGMSYTLFTNFVPTAFLSYSNLFYL